MHKHHNIKFKTLQKWYGYRTVEIPDNFQLVNNSNRSWHTLLLLLCLTNTESCWRMDFIEFWGHKFCCKHTYTDFLKCCAHFTLYVKNAISVYPQYQLLFLVETTICVLAAGCGWNVDTVKAICTVSIAAVLLPYTTASVFTNTGQVLTLTVLQQSRKKVGKCVT